MFLPEAEGGAFAFAAQRISKGSKVKTAKLI